mmetsp:Transcript_13901/g.19310  ORF Transcript_13901/g.19310 Transcript_13901/m.19310 type:complete len:561 (+) Transcript_13901:240-1922(+)
MLRHAKISLMLLLAGIILIWTSYNVLPRHENYHSAGGRERKNIEDVYRKKEKQRSVAICLVGQIRSLKFTASNLRKYLLDHLEADAFVVASVSQNSNDLYQFDFRRSLGPRVKVSLSLSDENLYIDKENYIDLYTSAAYDELLYTRNNLRNWAQAFSAQLMNRHRCYQEILKFQEKTGVQYEVFGRFRLDIMLFEPIPLSWISLIRNSTPGTAVIPAGGDWGKQPATGIFDMIILGDLRALSADAYEWRYLTSDNERFHRTWIAENLHREALEGNNISIIRRPLLFCTYLNEGKCKYMYQLYDSLKNLLRREKWEHVVTRAILPSCGNLGIDSYSCDPTEDIFAPDDTKASDPGFCSLKSMCRRGYQDYLKSLALGGGRDIGQQEKNLVAFVMFMSMESTSQLQKLIVNMHRWRKHLPCKFKSSKGKQKEDVTWHFFFADTENLKIRSNIRLIKKLWAKGRQLTQCLGGEPKFIPIPLTPEQNRYPQVTCTMFYRALEIFRNNFTHMVQLEPDVLPIRSGWASHVISLARGNKNCSNFWQMGSYSHNRDAYDQGDEVWRI